MKKLIRKGKVKEVYEIGEERLNFFFPDNVSVFDKIVPNDIPRKGETICKTSTYWFHKAEEELGMNTHFIERVDENSMMVKKIDPISENEKIDESTVNHMIPLEFISRYFVAGSLKDRIEKGIVDYTALGFDEVPEYGERLSEPVFEVKAKFGDDDIEKTLSKNEALDISGLTEYEFREIRENVFKMDEIIKQNVEKNGLYHVDGKKEFALDENRDIMLVDTFGTVDEDRFWDIEEYEKGNFVRKGKGFLIRYYENMGYYRSIKEANEKNEEEPSIPPLPDDMVERTSEIYIDMMKRITDGEYN